MNKLMKKLMNKLMNKLSNKLMNKLMKERNIKLTFSEEKVNKVLISKGSDETGVVEVRRVKLRGS